MNLKRALLSAALMIPLLSAVPAAAAGVNQQFIINSPAGNMLGYRFDLSGTGVGPWLPVFVPEDGNGNAMSNQVTKHAVSSTQTRIGNTTTYTSATSTAPEAICLFASTTPCAPLTLAASSVNTVSGNITAIKLVKSTTGATAATFRVLAYQGAPTLTGVFDASTYTPLKADIVSGAYLGSWECATQVVNSDNSTFECTSNVPSGNNGFNLANATLYFVVEATGAYVPGSGETFNVVADLLKSVP